MEFCKSSVEIFNRAIRDYHVYDNVDHAMNNPFTDQFDGILYEKCWIDTIQWHLEDIIRDPQISPDEALEIKRRIDASNQHRTDKVEQIDDYFLSEMATGQPQADARINTESPAWAIDRLSILCLKIYHMQEEVNRADAENDHRQQCEQKLAILTLQLQDLSTAIDQLLSDIKAGRVQMKLYRQMKMYNDPNLNPILYNADKK